MRGRICACRVCWLQTKEDAEAVAAAAAEAVASSNAALEAKRALLEQERWVGYLGCGT
jgi:hypothetical protein